MSTRLFIEEMKFTDEEQVTWNKAVEVARPFMAEIIRIGLEMKNKLEDEVPDFDSNDLDETGLFYNPSCELENIEFWKTI
jgi:hypothetical protein